MAYVHNSVNNAVKVNKAMNNSMLSLAGLFTQKDIIDHELKNISLLLKDYLSNDKSQNRNNEIDEFIMRFLSSI